MRQPIRSLRYPLAVDAGLGAITVEADHEAHVEQLMMQVLMTGAGERVNRPTFGCGIRRMVFAPTSDASANLARVMILQALETWLPTLISVDKVDVTFANERLDVSIAYRLKTTGGQRYLNVEVTP
jgi:phage baseplate assembly protein W